MQCQKCGYEPTMSEIQAGGDCPGCSAVERKKAAAQKPDAIGSPSYPGVVVVDIDLPFGSMVRFMVKWAIAAIPAFIILLIIAWGAGSIVHLLGMLGGSPPS
jgi:hypothetical protein